VRKKQKSMFEKLKRFMTREIPTKWAVAFIVAIVIFYLLFNILPYLTIPEWMITYSFYAFMTAILGFVFWICGLFLRDHFEIGKMKKTRRMEALDVLRSEYSRCKLSIEHDIKRDIESNEMTSLVPNLENTPDMGNVKVREELQRDINQYNEKVEDYNLFRKASDAYIRDSIERRVARVFPKTTKKNNGFHTEFYYEPFMKRYFDGEAVACNWLRESEPIVLKNITKDIDESEKDELDVLFKEINNDFQKESILLRFRKQKEIIRNDSKRLIEVLQKEISSIDKEFEQYDYLRVKREKDLKAKEKEDNPSIVPF
jgi:hypothetical protein